MQLDKARVTKIIRAALAEDIGRGDLTTASVIDRSSNVSGVIIAKEPCVICGIDIAIFIYTQ